MVDGLLKHFHSWSNLCCSQYFRHFVFEISPLAFLGVMVLCNMHGRLFLSAYFLAGTFGIIGITIVGSAFMVCFLVHINKIFLCGTIFHFYLCYKDQPMFSGFYNCIRWFVPVLHSVPHS